MTDATTHATHVGCQSCGGTIRVDGSAMQVTCERCGNVQRISIALISRVRRTKDVVDDRLERAAFEEQLPQTNVHSRWAGCFLVGAAVLFTLVMVAFSLSHQFPSMLDPKMITRIYVAMAWGFPVVILGVLGVLGVAAVRRAAGRELRGHSASLSASPTRARSGPCRASYRGLSLP